MTIVRLMKTIRLTLITPMRTHTAKPTAPPETESIIRAGGRPNIVFPNKFPKRVLGAGPKMTQADYWISWLGTDTKRRSPIAAAGQWSKATTDA